jgi:DNA-binding NarL/FixJ family response regulator
MRVLIADAHPEVRWALRTVIREEPGLMVVGEVSDADHLLDEARAQHPDVILLEWELPGRAGEELLADLGSLNNGFQVIVLSRRPEARQAALAAGAGAFVSKADAPEQLMTALRRLIHR